MRGPWAGHNSIVFSTPFSPIAWIWTETVCLRRSPVRMLRPQSLGKGESMKKTTLVLFVLAIASTSACKKKDAKPEAPAPAAEKAPAPTPEPEAAEPAGPAIPEVALTGSASENLVAVFEAGVNALKAAGDAKTGAAVLTGMLAKYDVADLRAKSKAAKAAGDGASAETKAKFKALKAEYGEVSTKLGGTDPEAFGEAAKAWAMAWGLN